MTEPRIETDRRRGPPPKALPGDPDANKLHVPKDRPVRDVRDSPAEHPNGDKSRKDRDSPDRR